MIWEIIILQYLFFLPNIAVGLNYFVINYTTLVSKKKKVLYKVGYII